MTGFKVKFLIVLVLGCAGFAEAQELWQGQYQSKRLLLSKTTQEGHQDSLHLSSPELMFDHLPLSQKIENDSLVLVNESYGLKLRTKAITGDSLNVVFTNYSVSHPILFKSVASLQPLDFPQHPKGDLPYTIQDIKFKGEKTQLTYGGTLVIPDGVKKYPLAFLVNGTGQQDRNYTYFGHQFFTVLADALARKGIASFRMDDRGKGKTTGDFDQATGADFVVDLEEAKAYLKRQKYIDHHFMGIIGHSEGGVVASIATAQNKDLKFMVSLSGVGVSGLKILDLQNTAILKAHAIPDTTVAYQMDLYNTLFQTVYNNQQKDLLKPELTAAIKKWMKGKDASVLRALQVEDGRDQTLIYRFYTNAKSNAYRYMIHYNPKVYLPKIKVPVFAVNGGEDIFVPAAENLDGFKTYLTNSPDFSSKIYPGLNHMYQHCITCTSEEMSTLDEVFATEVSEDVTQWIWDVYKGHNK